MQNMQLYKNCIVDRAVARGAMPPNRRVTELLYEELAFLGHRPRFIQ